ncbi:M20/M25/M40 family metallo-hydrolase [Saccharothrix longispora]|uniref:M20/M25/M40 family metallo-hydrolase n=1 Tax=Saccharothrix longispora TaxID=33920 RepID=UPI0028FD0327|nr:M20/M25/M40 family metallo-hydrolase [Saccharothrix longispora]MDU0290943.1 M20/M25/M40 family metallo-hydrolase [Saccharothrix longispora]
MIEDARSRWSPVLLAVLAAVAALAVLAFRPPAPVADAPADAFAAGRAEEHLREIAQRPHPIGSADNERVRDHLVRTARDLGAEVTVESDDVVHRWRDVERVATAHNVVARVRGSDPALSGGKALLLVAHHDSVPTGPGAADDGAAVAAMLETLRALTTSGVRNDVVFLFTDGEEAGTLGAEAFVRRHGVGGYGAVLNWEARGSGGPVWMFQTGPGNGPLVDAFAGASSRPIANSLAYEVYRRMPNYSDFSVFLDAGARGLNSAFIEHVHDYHSPYDDLERLDRGSLQHHGETMVGLVRALGDRDLRTVDGSSAVYFDLFSRVLVHYPVWFAVVLALLTALGLGAALFVRRGRLAWRRVLFAAAVSAGAVVVAGGAAFGVWALVAAVRPELGFLALSEPYERGWFVAGFLLLGLTALLAAVRPLRRCTRTEALAGALVLTAVLLVASALVVPGASFLFQWPLLLGLPALWSPRLFVLPPLAAAVVHPPLVGTLLVALGMPLAAAGVVFALLAGVLLLPLLIDLPRFSAPVAAALAVALVAVGVVRVDFTEAEQRPNSLIYLQDGGTGESSWLSADPRPDEWTSRVLGDDPERVTLTDEYPMLTTGLMRADAPDLDLPAPTAELLGSTTGERRTVTFRVTPTPSAWRTQVTLPAGDCRTGDLELGARVLELYGSAPRDLVCELDPGAPLTVVLADHSTGLPPRAAALVGPRPGDTMPVQSGNRAFDAALVRAVFRL